MWFSFHRNTSWYTDFRFNILTLLEKAIHKTIGDIYCLHSCWFPFIRRYALSNNSVFNRISFPNWAWIVYVTYFPLRNQIISKEQMIVGYYDNGIWNIMVMKRKLFELLISLKQ